MTDYEALLRGVLLAPADDLPRLVLADWLQDNGDPERAEFIRAQVRLAEISPLLDAEIHQTGMCSPYCNLCPEYASLITEEYDWLWKNRIQIEPPDSACDWSRGFVDRIELPTAAFLQHARDLFSAHPITTVRLSDVGPTQIFSGQWIWEFEEYPAYIEDPEIAATLTELVWSSSDNAEAYLSQLLVAYGRRLANLEAHP